MHDERDPWRPDSITKFDRKETCSIYPSVLNFETFWEAISFAISHHTWSTTAFSTIADSIHVGSIRMPDIKAIWADVKAYRTAYILTAVSSRRHIVWMGHRKSQGFHQALCLTHLLIGTHRRCVDYEIPSDIVRP